MSRVSVLWLCKQRFEREERREKQNKAMQALLERWLDNVESYNVKNASLIKDTKTLLKEAKEMK